MTRLRDEADIVVTNPPFSLFREFLAWVMDGGKRFSVIGNMNAITYKEVFPLLKENRIWTGYQKGHSMSFMIPQANHLPDKNGPLVATTCKWFTNLDHVGRHEPLMLDTMAGNLRYNRKLRKTLINKYGQTPDTLHYPKYDNYDAIEVPYVECIPGDYTGVMGVPISFLDKYDPDQFEIIGRTGDLEWCKNGCGFYTPPTPEHAAVYAAQDRTWRIQNSYLLINGTPKCTYGRIFVCRR